MSADIVLIANINEELVLQELVNKVGEHRANMDININSKNRIHGRHHTELNTFANSNTTFNETLLFEDLTSNNKIRCHIDSLFKI